MADIETVISDSREAVGAFLATAEAVPASAWARPAAPGKWSAAQVTEHVALAYELSRAVLRKTYTGWGLPRLLRPIVRTVFLRRVLRRGTFGKGNKAPGPPGRVRRPPRARCSGPGSRPRHRRSRLTSRRRPGPGRRRWITPSSGGWRSRICCGSRSSTSGITGRSSRRDALTRPPAALRPAVTGECPCPWAPAFSSR